MNRSNRPFNAFTKAATVRILGVYPQCIKAIKEFAHVVWVHIIGKRPTFISKKLYRADFLAQRQEAAKAIQVKPQGRGAFLAWNPANGNAYEVTPAPVANGYQCECEDYTRQYATYGKALCKHVLSVKAALSDSLTQAA